MTILTLALLLMNISSFGTLLLFLKQQRQKRGSLPSDERVQESLTRMEDKLDTLIRRIAQIKTRLADEERDDQKAKARARYQAKKHI